MAMNGAAGAFDKGAQIQVELVHMSHHDVITEQPILVRLLVFF